MDDNIASDALIKMRYEIELPEFKIFAKKSIHVY